MVTRERMGTVPQVQADTGTHGHGDTGAQVDMGVGTQGQHDTQTWAHMDMGTCGHSDTGAHRHGEMGTGGRRYPVTQPRGDTVTPTKPRQQQHPCPSVPPMVPFWNVSRQWQLLGNGTSVAWGHGHAAAAGGQRPHPWAHRLQARRACVCPLQRYRWGWGGHRSGRPCGTGWYRPSAWHGIGHPGAPG